MKTILAAMVMVILAVSVARTGLDEGVAAYGKADYAKALREFKPLAAKGNAKAQSNLVSCIRTDMV